MQKIAPCIWYDQEAMEAAELYVSAFDNSRIEYVTHYLENDASPSELPAGTVLTVRFTLCGQEFNALNGGPVFNPTPAVSFYVDCESEAQMDALWAKLSNGGFVLMEVAEYPFSKRFRWLADRYGVRDAETMGKMPTFPVVFEITRPESLADIYVLLDFKKRLEK